MIKVIENKKLDYVSNNLIRTFPIGFDIEIFTNTALKKAKKFSKTQYEKEHVTPYLKRSKKIKKFNFRSKINLSKIRVTLDTKEDYQKIKKIFNFFKPDIYFDYVKFKKLRTYFNFF